VKIILGISAFYHDSAAAILVDGKIVAAAQEERFTRVKHDKDFPINAIKFVLKFANVNLSGVDNIIFYEKPFLKFERLLETYIAFAPKGFLQFSKSIPKWLKENLFQKNELINSLQEIENLDNFESKLLFSEHHQSHAASAYYPSPFDEAIILTADGVGEWATTTVAIAKKNKIKIISEIHFPHSLGLLYSAFTFYCGFKVNSGEYKLMGLAPYGNPIYKKEIYDNLIDIKEDGSFRLNQNYFEYTTGFKMINSRFENLFGKKARDPNLANIEQFHMDIASSIQEVTEEIILKICKYLKKKYNINNLCLAGGVALNCVANGKILENKIFDNLWVQPAAGDAGGSLGAALFYWYNELESKRIISNIKLDEMEGSYLGPEYSDDEIEKELIHCEAQYEKVEEEDLINKVATSLSNGEIIGWFQGRMEFGPRALGSRSILADPRAKDMQKKLNLKIKFRESFRPFAPSILSEFKNEWFNLNTDSPYMQIVSKINDKHKFKMSEKDISSFGIDKLNLERSTIPSVTHVDYSARIQTVHKETNKKYYNLINKFNELTKCPILVNTSFNVRGEPIVNTPTDAFRCFMGTGLDQLIIGNFILKKYKQTIKTNLNYKEKFKLD
jgi:carbamoyltransferase